MLNILSVKLFNQFYFLSPTKSPEIVWNFSLVLQLKLLTSMLKSLMFSHLHLITILIHIQIVGYHAKVSYLQLSSSLAPTVFTSSSACAKHFLSPFSFAQLLSACSSACDPFCCFILYLCNLQVSLVFPSLMLPQLPSQFLLCSALHQDLLFCSVLSNDFPVFLLMENILTQKLVLPVIECIIIYAKEICLLPKLCFPDTYPVAY